MYYFQLITPQQIPFPESNASQNNSIDQRKSKPVRQVAESIKSGKNA